jgi:hypothetical protein
MLPCSTTSSHDAQIGRGRERVLQERGEEEEGEGKGRERENGNMPNGDAKLVQIFRQPL